ncbi:hypothetical protein METBIDRAFT_33066 [Metschnikowia bicuspidata var. bicuspidata NRRL YB-4993]|uniref:Ribosomal RNA-processing protein 17 n=1 Tax=Metschnikowia bicuspidata var. bicuspidata NRRL YB-4993 TaxID=869754 RepID=A0A1A0H7N5_9ASCO|nr:hypothetical protein METBIDRAFT_33066 [Metschnikowia bicuspidata var. bicuspidata NRRL YB-4993]OBA20109.1 hypothetical protein METBIDRAFT_33066 [Metschnikowia bicuspidata var. bicuspidata NRRL YB-4993]
MANKKPSPRTNRDILTGGSKYRSKQTKKFGVEEVVFDKDSRHEFLTGFHKRKVERQKKAKKFHEEQDRLAKIEERKQIREEKQKEFEAKMEELKEAKNLDVSEILKQENDEEQWEGFGSDDQDNEEKPSDIASDDEPLKGILQKKQIYKIDNLEALGDAVVDDETTVTVEALENPNFARVGQSSLDLMAQTNNVNLSKSEEVLEKSIERAKKYAVVCGVSKPQQKQKKKKFRYLTKTERRENNRKVKLNKLKSRKKE